MSRPFSILAVTLGAAASAAVLLAAQQPRIVNGRIAPAPSGTALPQVLQMLLEAQAEPAWIGYRVPAVPGGRFICCFDSGSASVGAGPPCRLEPPADGTSMTDRGENRGARQRLESSDWLVVLLRVAERRIDRVRVFSDDCELDAGGRPVTWLDAVRPDESIAMLESLASPEDSTRSRRVLDGAISAVALHAGDIADRALERLTAPQQPEAVRKKVAFWLGNARGAFGLALLQRLVREDPSAEVRKSAVFGISQSGEPSGLDALLAVARKHEDARVRGDAIFWLGQRAGAKAAAVITERIEQDPETEVKKRAVFALSQLPKDEGVPLLIQVARTNRNREVRRQAMFWLGQSRDPRAVEFFAEVLAR